MTKQELKNYLSETVAQIKDELELTAALFGKQLARQRWCGAEPMIVTFIGNVWGEAEVDTEWAMALLATPEGLKLP